jgi:hypothetical protein
MSIYMPRLAISSAELRKEPYDANVERGAL